MGTDGAWLSRAHGGVMADRATGHSTQRPPAVLRRRLILGIILGSFFYLVVSCYYWTGGHMPKIDRANFKFNPGDKQ